jgi:hypothetical protein
MTNCNPIVWLLWMQSKMTMNDLGEMVIKKKISLSEFQEFKTLVGYKGEVVIETEKGR